VAIFDNENITYDDNDNDNDNNNDIAERKFNDKLNTKRLKCLVVDINEMILKLREKIRKITIEYFKQIIFKYTDCNARKFECEKHLSKRIFDKTLRSIRYQEFLMKKKDIKKLNIFNNYYDDDHNNLDDYDDCEEDEVVLRIGTDLRIPNRPKQFAYYYSNFSQKYVQNI
jgi:hypothetical protein